MKLFLKTCFGAHTLQVWVVESYWFQDEGFIKILLNIDMTGFEKEWFLYNTKKSGFLKVWYR